MDSQIAASLIVLEAELRRLEQLSATAPASQALVLREAAGLIATSIKNLAAAREAAEPATLPPTLKIADRIVVLAPPTAADTFRTKVKLKAPEPRATTTPPVAAAPRPDDLTRIRGIDAALAIRLAAQGVTSFADIAAWARADVRRIGDALGLGRQISRQNWIEQAAILSGPAAKPAQPTVVPTAPVAVVEPLPVEAKEPAAPLSPDPLHLITGIDIGLAEALRAFGVTQWSEIATFRRDDIKRLSRQLNLPTSIARQGWIEQAALLASGRLSHHAMRVLRGDFAALVPRPAIDVLPAPVFATWQQPLPLEVEATEPVVIPITAPIPSIVLDEDTLDFAIPLSMLPEAEIELPQLAATETDLVRATITAMDRVTALAEELAAHVANDARPAAPEVPAPAKSRVSSLHIEDEEFPELHVAEADVKIVRKPSEQQSLDAKPANTATRTLLARLKRSSPLDDIDKANYAGYRDTVEEASVEIVKPGSSAAKPVAPPTPRPAAPAQRSIKRLLRPFSGGGSN